MSAKHTEGPWIVQPGTLTIYTLSNGTTGTTNAIAVPCRQSRDGGSSVSFDEAEANARLIAAAPDMLAALQRYIESDACDCSYGVDAHYDTCPWCQAKAAIAKATVEA